MSARARLERICGPQTPPELITELDTYRNEVLAENGDAAAERDCLAMAVQFALQWKDSATLELREGIEEILATMPAAKEGSRDEAEPAPELTIYRASHDAIVMGHYTIREAAREHCETVLRRELGDGVWIGWVPDDGSEDAPEELCFSDEVLCSGYVVAPLEVASEYDEEADE